MNRIIIFIPLLFITNILFADGAKINDKYGKRSDYIEYFKDSFIEIAWHI